MRVEVANPDFRENMPNPHPVFGHLLPCREKEMAAHAALVRLCSSWFENPLILTKWLVFFGGFFGSLFGEELS